MVLKCHKLRNGFNSIGGGGGIGNDFGTGIGSGRGPGAGAASGAGLGGLYRGGEGVTTPRAIYDRNPEYSEEARKSRTQGTVVLSVIVDAAGNARNVRVVRSLGMGLDQKAIEAVERWKFQPAIKDGYAVAVQVNVEVNFRLY
jgi:periplasmic protein TonB